MGFACRRDPKLFMPGAALSCVVALAACSGEAPSSADVHRLQPGLIIGGGGGGGGQITPNQDCAANPFAVDILVPDLVLAWIWPRYAYVGNGDVPSAAEVTQVATQVQQAFPDFAGAATSALAKAVQWLPENRQYVTQEQSLGQYSAWGLASTSNPGQMATADSYMHFANLGIRCNEFNTGNLAKVHLIPQPLNDYSQIWNFSNAKGDSGANNGNETDDSGFTMTFDGGGTSYNMGSPPQCVTFQETLYSRPSLGTTNPAHLYQTTRQEVWQQFANLSSDGKGFDLPMTGASMALTLCCDGTTTLKIQASDYPAFYLQQGPDQNGLRNLLADVSGIDARALADLPPHSIGSQRYSNYLTNDAPSATPSVGGSAGHQALTLSYGGTPKVFRIDETSPVY